MDNTGHVRENGIKKKTEIPIQGNKILNNELRRETNRAKEKFINKTCDEITKFQQTEKVVCEKDNLLMYQKIIEFEWKENKDIQTFGTQESLRDTVTY